MGNQAAKPAKRTSQVYPFTEPEKKSRTDWTAGRSCFFRSLIFLSTCFLFLCELSNPLPSHWCDASAKCSVAPLCAEYLLPPIPPPRLSANRPFHPTNNYAYVDSPDPGLDCLPIITLNGNPAPQPAWPPHLSPALSRCSAGARPTSGPALQPCPAAGREQRDRRDQHHLADPKR